MANFIGPFFLYFDLVNLNLRGRPMASDFISRSSWLIFIFFLFSFLLFSSPLPSSLLLLFLSFFPMSSGSTDEGQSTSGPEGQGPAPPNYYTQPQQGQGQAY